MLYLLLHTFYASKWLTIARRSLIFTGPVKKTANTSHLKLLWQQWKPKSWSLLTNWAENRKQLQLNITDHQMLKICLQTAWNNYQKHLKTTWTLSRMNKHMRFCFLLNMWNDTLTISCLAVEYYFLSHWASSRNSIQIASNEERFFLQFLYYVQNSIAWCSKQLVVILIVIAKLRFWSVKTVFKFVKNLKKRAKAWIKK